MPEQHLESITLRGYKSIRELSEFPMHRGLNVLIGANGSGKTNFIRFFDLLAHMMDPNKGLQNYVAERGRADAFLFRGMKVTPELQAELKFGRNEYRFTLRAAADRSLFFAQESAPFNGPHHGQSIYEQGSGHLESKVARNDQQIRALTWAKSTIQNWRLYHFHDTSSSAPVMGLCNTVDNAQLHGDASNLAAVLTQLQEWQHEHFKRIVETVRQVAPFFGEFVLRDISGKTQLLWKDRHSDLVLYPHQLSDGTLRYICLATLLLHPTPPSLVLIDEPELGLHPTAIKLLGSLLNEASAHTQLIVSTQSSQLVDELTPEQVIVVGQKDGESTFERLSTPKLEDWLEEYTLGQLWEKNEFGGLP